MKANLFWKMCVLCGLAMSQYLTAAPGTKGSGELAERILADQRLTRVQEAAKKLLTSGLNAGDGYAEIWIRDLNTFIVPALEANPRDAIREALLVFFHFQGEEGDIVDGYVPLEKAQVNYKYRTVETQPKFKAHKNTVETDQESSLVLAVARYLKKTGDKSILEQDVRGATVLARLEEALHYPLIRRFSKEHGLIWGATTVDWGDVQPEHPWGVELDESSHRAIDIYDNALFASAVKEFMPLLPSGDTAKIAEWKAVHSSIIANARKHLWDSRRQKFKAHIYLEGSPFPETFDEGQVYYHGGTAVAVEAGMLSREEILVAYGQMLANVRMAGAASIGLTVYPPYPEGAFKNPSMKPWSYQNGGDWTWFGARMVRQLAANGFGAEAYRELEPMVDRVLKHNGFFEWWTVGNAPHGSGTYRGEAGVLFDAIDELRAWARRETGN